MKYSKFKKQCGFAIGAILLVVALIAIVAGAIAAATKGSTNNTTDTQANTTNAATLRYQAAQLETGFERKIANGVDAASITFDAAATTGLFGADGTVQQQQPPAALTTNDWTYNKLTTMTGFGSAAVDYSVTLDLGTGASALGACTAIQVGVEGGAGTPVTSTATAAALTSAPAAATIAAAGEACVVTSDTHYVYIRGVVAN